MISIISAATWIFQQIINTTVIILGPVLRENQGVVMENIWMAVLCVRSKQEL